MSIIAAKAAWETIKSFLPTSAQQVITMVAVASLCLVLGFCKGDDYRDSKWKAKIALAEVKDLTTTNIANEAASTDRVTDALRITKQEEELIDAISEIPDSAPSDVRVAAGCQRLLNNGYSVEQLPAICRHKDVGGASPSPAN